MEWLVHVHEKKCEMEKTELTHEKNTHRKDSMDEFRCTLTSIFQLIISYLNNEKIPCIEALCFVIGKF